MTSPEATFELEDSVATRSIADSSNVQPTLRMTWSSLSYFFFSELNVNKAYVGKKKYIDGRLKAIGAAVAGAELNGLANRY
jgi:hypothetical protein